jgi:uncharacterized membrane protein
VPLSRLIDHWVDARIITRDQGGQLIESAATAQPVTPARTSEQRAPLMIEAVGYLGGAILVSGCILVVSRTWEDLDTAWRASVLGLAALLVLAAMMIALAAPGSGPEG